MKDQELVALARNNQTGALDKTLASKPEDSALATSKAVPGPVRVLVADDCESDRELTIWHLNRAWPFERDVLVERVTNGKEALERLRRSRFALAVLDWNMPYLGGRDVLKKIREDGIYIPVLWCHISDAKTSRGT
jgi:CheY-like chemotaxis protein